MLSVFLLVKAQSLSVLPHTGLLAYTFACAHTCAQAVSVDRSALWEVGAEAGRQRVTGFPFSQTLGTPA